MTRYLTRPLIFLIKGYQQWISPAFAPRCKYYPSCSQYAVDAISEYKFRGVALSLWRFARCNPWSHGGVDYIPPRDHNAAKNLVNTREMAK